MSSPYVVEQQVGAHLWYVVSGAYPTAYMAKQTWERIEKTLKTGTVGVYRHGPESDPGRIITAVAMDLDEVRRVMHALRLAEHNELPERARLDLIGRRAKVVIEAMQRGQSSGRLKWRRPDDRGAVLDPETLDMIEREPGEG